MERVHEKLDKIDEKLAEINITLVKQEAQLAEHMRRTAQNETLIEKTVDALKPVIKHVNQMEGALKLIGIVSLLVGIAVGIFKVLI